MKILYYNWNENSADDMIETLVLLGHQDKNIHIDIIDYNEDPYFCYALEDELKKESYDLIFTFDFLLKFYKSKFQFKIKKKTVDKQFGTGYNKNDDFLSEFVPNT